MEKSLIALPTFIKWAGGKTQLIEQFKPLFPRHFKRYFEPMIGSGAVFFYVVQKYKPEFVMISDINEELINLYLVVRERVDELIEQLKIHKGNHSKNYYYEMREEFNSTKDPVKKAALFIYLNKTCFNGLYRVNSKGEFNVPFGDYKSPAIFQEAKLKEASGLLKNVEIKTMSFESILSFAKKGDFIYFDPPYYPLSKTSSFTSYQKGSFLDAEQKKLAEVFRKLHEKECFVMLSNSDCDFIRNLYKDFKITTVRARRAISCIGTKRGEINEIVVTNY